MSLYAQGVNAANALVGPYRQRANRFAAGAVDLHRHGRHFYTRGITGAIQVSGFKNSVANFLVDLVQLLLMAGGVYLVITSIFG